MTSTCQWASNSVYYLLGLWSRLVTSVPYLKGDTPSLLDETVPKITEDFISSRFSSVQVSYCYFFIAFLTKVKVLSLETLLIAGWIYGWSLRQSIGQCWTSSRSTWVLSLPLQIPGWHFSVFLLNFPYYFLCYVWISLNFHSSLYRWILLRTQVIYFIYLYSLQVYLFYDAQSCRQLNALR